MKHSPWLVFAIAVGVVLLVLIIHNAEDWPIVSLSPTIEPLFIAAIAMFVVPPFGSDPAEWRSLRSRSHWPVDQTVVTLCGKDIDHRADDAFRHEGS
jgi:hypothetical protein